MHDESHVVNTKKRNGIFKLKKEINRCYLPNTIKYNKQF